ncbi:hypothetical protein C8Q76DRAFT_635673, partial [Earliella scabrosa]
MQQRFGGHKTGYYFRLILQNVLGIKKDPRKPSLWNAFVSLELKKLNADQASTPDGPQRVNSIAIKDLSTRWKAMSPEEQKAVAGAELEKLIERQKNKVQGVQNVKQNACNDTRATLASVSRQLEELHGRTHNEFVLFAVRSDIEDYNPPYVFYSGERMADAMKLLTKISVEDVAVKLEAYCLLGVDGLTHSAREQTVKLKHEVKELILQRLQAACTRYSITKMFYVNFEEHITARFGIFVKNWPLRKFTAPGSLSRVELEVLLKAWQNNVTQFQELSDDEWAKW